VATNIRVRVNPDVLRWARVTAKLDVETAGHRIGVGADRVHAWEDGSAQPTLNQVRQMSNQYHRPLAAFFMPQPLEKEELRDVPDFRRPATRASVDPASLQRAVMRAYRQRDALREIADDFDTPDDERFASFALSADDTAEVSGERLRAALSMDAIGQSVVERPEEFLRALTHRAESLGVTVTQVQRVPVSLMRGFSLADGTFPVIALNGADWPRGKAYTLLHELAHVGFRVSGLCDLQRDQDPKIERLCEETAAAALMPAKAFLSRIGRLQGAGLDVAVASALGSGFGASGEAAVLRMIELRRATWGDYQRLKPEFEDAYTRFKAQERGKSESTESLPIFYQLKARDLGRPFIRQVLRAYDDDALSSRDLVQLLEVTYDKIPRLAGVLGDVAV